MSNILYFDKQTNLRVIYIGITLKITSLSIMTQDAECLIYAGIRYAQFLDAKLSFLSFLGDVPIKQEQSLFAVAST